MYTTLYLVKETPKTQPLNPTIVRKNKISFKMEMEVEESTALIKAQFIHKEKSKRWFYRTFPYFNPKPESVAMETKYCLKQELELSTKGKKLQKFLKELDVKHKKWYNRMLKIR